MIRLLNIAESPYFYQTRVSADGGTLESLSCLAQLGYVNVDIIPRDYNIATSDVYSLNIVEEGTNIKQTTTKVHPVLNGNYIKISFVPTIFKQDHLYTIHITKNGVLWFRDKVSILTVFDKTKTYTLNKDKYQENVNSDTEYITL